MKDVLLEMRSITKTFPGVKALDDVSLMVRKARSTRYVGENGAGKSTLMKVLSGVYPAGSYEGEIHYDGALAEFRDIADSEARHHHHPPGTRAGAADVDRREPVLGNEMRQQGAWSTGARPKRTEALLRKVGLREAPARWSKSWAWASSNWSRSPRRCPRTFGC
jgi:putative multiple sugar transport system ATP-binding protein